MTARRVASIAECRDSEGDCFWTALWVARSIIEGNENDGCADLERANLTVVHAFVDGTEGGPAGGLRFVHAWVEFTPVPGLMLPADLGPQTLPTVGIRFALDLSNGNRTICPANHFRGVANAGPTREYPAAEAWARAESVNLCGPWDEIQP